MPELPEVQTTVDGLRKRIVKKRIVDVWTDIAVSAPSLKHHESTTKSALYFKKFKKLVCGATVKSIDRRGKNILMHLSNNHTVWVHMKMTGHLMYGKYIYDNAKKEWVPHPTEKNGALHDPFNRFLHTVFTFDTGKHLVLSDVRKFAKVAIFPTSDTSSLFSDLGPEPLDRSFLKQHFIDQLTLRKKRPVKEVLLDQKIIAGIGNIYSDEMLWLAGVHPLRPVEKITAKEFGLLYKGMVAVLEKGIAFGGDSTSDYRDIDGNHGSFQAAHNAYRMTGKPCRKRGCTGEIVRIPFSGRGAHFCPVHQK